MSKVRYHTDCRGCNAHVSALIPGEVASNDSEGQRVRCSKCGTINHVKNNETDGPITA